jgi:hypothetical protein
MPVFDGKLRNSSIAASNPPADPPIPAIGQFKFGLPDSDSEFGFDDFGRGDFLPLVFTREEDALDVAFCFAAMGHFRLIGAQASHKLRLREVERHGVNAVPLQLRRCRLISEPSAMSMPSPSTKSIHSTSHPATIHL